MAQARSHQRINPADVGFRGKDTRSAEGREQVRLGKPTYPLPRLRHQFAPAWNLAISVNVGGFDVGSRFSWQVLAALDYEFCRSKNVTWSGMLGYKALSVDYSQGSGLSLYRFDMTMHGPVFGLTARF